MRTDKIISVSRRTDIPAFYSEWFMNGIRRGYVDSINPFNRKYVSRVSLKPEDVTCFVFWTKNPEPMIKYLKELDDLGYYYYFQFTLTPYGIDIEQHVPSKSNEIIETFKALSRQIGKEKVIWRYDPILINHQYTFQYHIRYFEKLVKLLQHDTKKIVISFIDLYQKTQRNMGDLEEISVAVQDELASELSKIAHHYNLEISTCSELLDLDHYQIQHGKCIDDDLISQIIGNNNDVVFKKDKGQRKSCGCIESIDIGAPNTCQHMCTYCYANVSMKTVEKNIKLHDPNSTLLCGKLLGDEVIHWRNGKNLLIK